MGSVGEEIVPFIYKDSSAAELMIQQEIDTVQKFIIFICPVAFQASPVEQMIFNS
jgi:hypothetical protein